MAPLLQHETFERGLEYGNCVSATKFFSNTGILDETMCNFNIVCRNEVQKHYVKVSGESKLYFIYYAHYFYNQTHF